MGGEKQIEKRKKDYKNNGFIVAEMNNEIVGFCRYVDNNERTKEIKNADCELMAIYVKSSLKQREIGKKLFNYVKNKFKNMGKTKMVLWCLKDNFPSRKFYEKMGRKLVGEKMITFGNKDYPEVAFEYNLLNE